MSETAWLVYFPPENFIEGTRFLTPSFIEEVNMWAKDNLSKYSGRGLLYKGNSAYGHKCWFIYCEEDLLLFKLVYPEMKAEEL